MKTHWFPLIRPAIRAGYFLGGKRGIGGYSYLRFPWFYSGVATDYPNRSKSWQGKGKSESPSKGKGSGKGRNSIHTLRFSCNVGYRGFGEIVDDCRHGRLGLIHLRSFVHLYIWIHYIIYSHYCITWWSDNIRYLWFQFGYTDHCHVRYPHSRALCDKHCVSFPEHFWSQLISHPWQGTAWGCFSMDSQDKCRSPRHLSTIMKNRASCSLVV